MATEIKFTQNENQEDCILIHLKTEDLIRLEMIFKSMSHCLTEFVIQDIQLFDNSDKLNLKLQNASENIGMSLSNPDYIEWKQRSESWYIFKSIISDMRHNSRQKMRHELTKDIRNQYSNKIFVYWED